MEWPPIVANVFALIVAFYFWIKSNRSVQASIFLFGIVFFILSFTSSVIWGQDIVVHVSSRVRYCSYSKSFAGCFFSLDYERYRSLELSTQPTEGQCNLCRTRVKLIERQKIVYKTLKAYDGLYNDLPLMWKYIDVPIQDASSGLSEMAGISNILLSPATGITFSDGTTGSLYESRARYDSFLPNTINYDRNCLNYSYVRILVKNDTVSSVTWIGDITKACFDVFWLPQIALSDKFSMDERYRVNNIHTIIRFSDKPKGRLLIITSRPLNTISSHVGIRISWISPHTKLVSNYDDYTQRGIFKETEGIAAR